MATGTSDSRCSRVESAIDRVQVGRAAACAASSATSRSDQYVPRCDLAVRPHPQPAARRQLLGLAVRAAAVGHPVVEQRGDQRRRRRSAARAELAGQRLELGREHHAAAARGTRNSGLMPSWSRTSTSSPVRSSNTPNANMPRSRGRQSVPQRRHASSSTSVSDVPRNRTPARLQLGAQLRGVVQLAVVGERQPVGDHRLRAGLRQVDDRQPAVAQVDLTGAGRGGA